MEQLMGTSCKTNKTTTTVINPRTGDKLYEVCYTSSEELKRMTNELDIIQKKWSELTYKSRANFLPKYYNLLAEHKDELVQLIILENGKLEKEAEAEVNKALELTQFAISIPSLINGKTQEVSKGVVVKECIEPVGNVLLITPFNFPLMIPHWNLLNVLVLGNGAILKPSTQTPKTIQLIVRLLEEAGVPKGLIQIAYGEEKTVQQLIADKVINAVTFVGSSPVAKIVYESAAKHGKRALALGGAKNYTIVMDNIDYEVVSNELIESAFGMCGQRCMATSVLVIVGKDNKILDYLLPKCSSDIKIAPLVNENSKQKLVNYLKESNSIIHLDGLHSKNGEELKSFEVKPSIIEFEKPSDMKDEEMFGPLLEVVRFDTLEEAIKFQNKSKYANGASLYTSNGAEAEDAEKLSSGMIGVNVGVPVPREPYGFGGLKYSKFGYGEISGLNSLEFLINRKRITTKWNHKNKVDWTS